MPSGSFRCQVRLVLSDLDRQVYAQRTIATAQFPDEPDEHVLLRFLAWVLFYDEGMRDGQGWLDQTQPDLWAFDLTEQQTMWLECGVPPMKRLCKALGRSKNGKFIGLCAGDDDTLRFKKELLSERPRHLELVHLYTVPQDFVAWLEPHAGRSMDWTATISDGTLYLDCNGHSGQCNVAEVALA